MNIQVRGIRFFYNDDGQRAYKTLALADVQLVDLDLTIRGIRLTWSEQRGFIATAPIPLKCKNLPLQWNYKGEFGEALTAAIVESYRGMGGEMPQPKPERRIMRWVCAPEGYHPEESPEEVREMVYSAIDAVDSNGIDHEPANDNEAVEGLHRTLQVEVERACG